MSIEMNKALVRRWLTGFNEHNPAIFKEVLAPNYIFHEFDDTRNPTAEGTMDFWRNGWVTVPDARYDDDYIMVAEEDLVAVYATLRGTMAGSMKMPDRELPATNRAGSYKSFLMYRIEDDKIVESWLLFDRLGWQKWFLDD